MDKYSMAELYLRRASAYAEVAQAKARVEEGKANTAPTVSCGWPTHCACHRQDECTQSACKLNTLPIY